MSNDSSRTFVVTTFRCTVCGNALNVSYCNEPGKLQPRGEYVDDGITGADKVEQRINVHPCEKCLSPLNELRRAVKTLKDASA